MSFQNQVNIRQAFGVPGELIVDGPLRAEPLIVNSNGAPNVIGYAYTKSNTTNIASVGGVIGGDIVFAGILAAPKQYAGFGSAGDPLAPTLQLPDNNQGDFVTLGTLAAYLTTACKIGDAVFYDTTTGALSAGAPDSEPPAGTALVPNTIIYRYPVTAAGGGMTAIRLTN